MTGVLQQLPVEIGQRVKPGDNLARVADPTKLKAEVKIAETQAKDIQINLQAAIDTRNGAVKAMSPGSTRQSNRERSLSTAPLTACCREARDPT